MAGIEDTAGGSARKAWTPPGYEALHDRIDREGREHFGDKWTGEEREVGGHVLLDDATDRFGELYGLAGEWIEDTERHRQDIITFRTNQRALEGERDFLDEATRAQWEQDLAAVKGQIERHRTERNTSDAATMARLTAARRWAAAADTLRGKLAMEQLKAFVVSSRGVQPIPAQYWFDDTHGPVALRDGVSVGTAEVRHSTTGPRGGSYTVDDLKAPEGPIVLALSDATARPEGTTGPEEVSQVSATLPNGRPAGWDWSSIMVRAAAHYAIHHARHRGAMQKTALIQYMRQLGQEQNGRAPGDRTPEPYAQQIIDAFDKEQSARK